MSIGYNKDLGSLEWREEISMSSKDGLLSLGGCEGVSRRSTIRQIFGFLKRRGTLGANEAALLET